MSGNCGQLGLRISSLLDRELNELEARWLRNHIESCSTCEVEYRELRSARLSARAVALHEPPSDFWASVLNSIPVGGARLLRAREIDRILDDRVETGDHSLESLTPPHVVLEAGSSAAAPGRRRPPSDGRVIAEPVKSPGGTERGGRLEKTPRSREARGYGGKRPLDASGHVMLLFFAAGLLILLMGISLANHLENRPELNAVQYAEAPVIKPGPANRSKSADPGMIHSGQQRRGAAALATMVSPKDPVGSASPPMWTERLAATLQGLVGHGR